VQRQQLSGGELARAHSGRFYPDSGFGFGFGFPRHGTTTRGEPLGAPDKRTCRVRSAARGAPLRHPTWISAPPVRLSCIPDRLARMVRHTCRCHAFRTLPVPNPESESRVRVRSPMDLEHRVVLITGPGGSGPRWRSGRPRGAPTWRSATTSRATRPKRRRRPSGRWAGGRCVSRPTCRRAGLPAAGGRHGAPARPPRRAGEHGVALRGHAVRRADRGAVGRGLAVDLKAAFLCAARRCRTCARRRRPHHQHRRLAAGQRPHALQGVPAVLRGQERGGRPHRGPRPRVAGDGILVNAVARADPRAPDTGDEELKAVEQATPLGRWAAKPKS